MSRERFDRSRYIAQCRLTLTSFCLVLVSVWPSRGHGKSGAVQKEPSSASQQYEMLDQSKSLSASGDQGNLSLSVVASARAAAIAETFEVTVELDVPDGASVRFLDSAWDDAGFHLVGEVVDRDYKLDSSDSVRRWVRVYRVESYLAGEKVLPLVRAEVLLTESEDPLVLVSETSSVFIEGSIGEDASFEDYRDLKALPESKEAKAEQRVLWAALGGFALLAVIVWFLRTRYQRRTGSPRLVAIGRLGLWLTELREEVSRSDGYEQLSIILRDYMSLSLGINAATRSRAELVTELTQRRVPDPIIQNLDHFLQLAERSRFAASSLSVNPNPTDVVSELKDASKLLAVLIDELSKWQSQNLRDGR